LLTPPNTGCPLGYRRLEPHDRNQLELKLAYLVPPNCKRHVVVTEAFIFAPRTLGITRQAYPPERFFEDTTRFIRLKTPDVPLADLAVLERVEQLLDSSSDTRPAEWRVRLLGCVYRRAIRDSARVLTQRLDVLATEDIDRLARDLLAFVEQLQVAREHLKAVVLQPVHGTLGAVVDEFVSLVAEASCTRLVEGIDNAGDGLPSLVGVRARAAEVAVEEYLHRRGCGYASYALEGDANEGLPHRRRTLKRVISSALYLDIGHERAGDLAQNFVGMVSAAAAMLFAILVAVWAQLRWEMTAWPFILVMVLSYVVKDRIKEVIKGALGKRAKGMAPDVVLKVRVPSTGAVVGLCREWFAVETPDTLDPEILRIRHIDHPEGLEEMGRPETVMAYRKEVALNAAGLQQGLANVEGLTDIIRFNLARLRRRMDAPIELYTLVHPETHELVEVPCGRVYHLNIVLRTTTRSDGAVRIELERVRVVLDQLGIRRVERVHPLAAVTDVEAAGLHETDSPDLV
jgi:hypothetical protein